MNVLNDNVLVLNRLWQAVNVCTVQRAMALLFIDHASVVRKDETGSFQTFVFEQWKDLSQQANDTDEYIHTVNFKVRVPKVILLKYLDRLPHKEVKFTRHNIFERDRNTCQYCGKHFDRRELNLDHVIPREQGGGTTWENIVCACIPCNTKKANRTPYQAGMTLHRKPKRPKWRPFTGTMPFSVMHPEWDDHMDFAGWEVEMGQNAVK